MNTIKCPHWFGQIRYIMPFADKLFPLKEYRRILMSPYLVFTLKTERTQYAPYLKVCLFVCLFEQLRIWIVSVWTKGRNRYIWLQFHSNTKQCERGHSPTRAGSLIRLIGSVFRDFSCSQTHWYIQKSKGNLKEPLMKRPTEADRKRYLLGLLGKGKLLTSHRWRCKFAVIF